MTILYNDKYPDVTFSNVITFFTPSFNRLRYLPRIVECLSKQSNRNFVWILVNDGSADNTDVYARELLKTVSFPMMYISKENEGKHSAFKIALDKCNTEYFQCMDDDDLFSSDSVDFFLLKWKHIKSEKRDDIGAIRVLTKKHDGTIMANFQIEKSEMGKEYDADTLEMNLIHNKRMENWTCYDTEKLRSVDLFPSDYWLCEQHKYFGEGIWQGRFARKYKCRYVNVILREYNSDDIDSLVRGSMTPQKRIDAFINSHMNLNEQWDYVKKNLYTLTRSLMACNVKRISAGIKLGEQLKHCDSFSLKLMLTITMPIAHIYKEIKG